MDYFSFCGQSAYTNTVGTVFLCTKEGYTDSEVTSKSFKVGWGPKEAKRGRALLRPAGHVDHILHGRDVLRVFVQMEKCESRGQVIDLFPKDENRETEVSHEVNPES